MSTIREMFDENDILAAQMGRFSDANEKMFEDLVTKRASLWRSFGKGRGFVDLSCPGHRSTRPATRKHEQSFTFQHRTFAKRREMQPDTNRSVHPGAGARKQRYIEREEALEKDVLGEISIGTIAETNKERTRFWRAVSQHERSGGRIQSSIIAELPYEKEIGPEGRRKIIEQFGKAFDGLNLMWHGVAHVPDTHSDGRNFHLHFIYHDRPASRHGELPEWQFAKKKCKTTRDRNFVKSLRVRYSEIVNEEYKEAKLARRFDPRTYEEMGISKKPGKHLGSAAWALERKGIVTTASRHNHKIEWQYRALNALDEIIEQKIQDLGPIKLILPLLQRAATSLSPSLNSRAKDISLLLVTFTESAELFRKIRALSNRYKWMATDLRIRARRAATGNPKGIVRREARAVLHHLDGHFSNLQISIIEEISKAKRNRKSAYRSLKGAHKKLEATFLLQDRRRIVRHLEMAERKLRKAPVSESQWRDQGRAQKAEFRNVHQQISHDTNLIAEYLENLFPTNSGNQADIIVTLLRSRKKRKRVISAIENELQKEGRKNIPVNVANALRNGINKIARFEAYSFKLKGKYNRRNRIESLSPDARSRYIIKDGTTSPQEYEVIHLRQELEIHDRKISSKPKALAMAKKLESISKFQKNQLGENTLEDWRIRCLVPAFDGALFSLEWKEALWDKFCMAAPQRQRQSVEQYKIVKRA